MDLYVEWLCRWLKKGKSLETVLGTCYSMLQGLSICLHNADLGTGGAVRAAAKRVWLPRERVSMGFLSIMLR